MGIRTQVLALVQPAPPPPPVTGRGQPWNNVTGLGVTETDEHGTTGPDIAWARKLGPNELAEEIRLSMNTMTVQQAELARTEQYIEELQDEMVKRMQGLGLKIETVKRS